MAMDPATAKIIAQAALEIAKNEEIRKKVIMIALIPIISVLLILSMFTYIITHPLDMLSAILSGNELTQATELHNRFSLDQNININDPSFKESSEVDFSKVTFADGAVEIKYFNQADNRWANSPYGKTGTIGTSGCGPTSLAMVVSSLLSKIIDPLQMSNWAYINGYRCEGNGSYHSLIPEGAAHFGLKAEGCSASEPQRLVDALLEGKLIIAIMSKGHFTQGGHFIVLRGVTKEGNILVADPISKARSEQKWDISTITGEACKQPGASGPFWILSDK